MTERLYSYSNDFDSLVKGIQELIGSPRSTLFGNIFLRRRDCSNSLRIARSGGEGEKILMAEKTVVFGFNNAVAFASGCFKARSIQYRDMTTAVGD